MKKILIAAGGTAGHINAALSLGGQFSKKYNVIYVSGERHLDFKLFEGKECLHIKSKPLRSKNILTVIKNLFFNLLVFFQMLFKFIKLRPVFIIGAGGYVCGPSLLAAKILGKPVFILEQNSVLGLTNKILSYIADLIFITFKNTQGIPNKFKRKLRLKGNPIKSSITFSENLISEYVNVLVFGGSLGAKQINEAVQEILKSQPKSKIRILHQVGKGNEFEAKNLNPFIEYKQVEYILDMNKQYQWANIIIARAGASTVTELRVIKKPAILIPLASKDNHQTFNAKNLKKENLSYIAVMNHKQPKEQLAEAMINQIDKIIKERLFYSNESENLNAVKEITKSIESYVRNK